MCDSRVDVTTYTGTHEVGLTAQLGELCLVLEASEADNQTLHAA